MMGENNPTSAGVSVTEDSAVNLVAVFACVRLLSESIGMLPLQLYKSLKVGKEKANYHPLYSILHDLPNPEISSLTFREIMMCNALLMPEAYAEIEHDNGGNVLALWPIPSNRVTPHRDLVTNVKDYIVSLPNGTQTIITSENMFILPGMGFNVDRPFKPVQMAREAIGLGLATEKFGSEFFGNGTNAGGIIEYPGKLGDEAYKRFKASSYEKYGGLNKANKLMFLEEGLKFTQLTIPPESAQFLQTRQFQVTEIARFFNVPPHMIQDLSGATFSNIEQKSLEYVTYSLMPWFAKWEQAIYKDLLSVNDRKKYYAKFTVDALLRGDFATRYNAYHLMLQDGVYNADEVRELEDDNPQTDGQGQIYLCNGNMIPKDLAGKQPAQVKAAPVDPVDDTKPVDPKATQLKGGAKKQNGKGNKNVK